MPSDKIRKVLFNFRRPMARRMPVGARSCLCADPNLDALAADSVLFRNHYCQASPCGPARTSHADGHVHDESSQRCGMARRSIRGSQTWRWKCARPATIPRCSATPTPVRPSPLCAG